MRFVAAVAVATSAPARAQARTTTRTRRMRTEPPGLGATGAPSLRRRHARTHQGHRAARSAPRVVPAQDHAPLPLEAELAQRGGPEQKPPAAARRQLDPAGAEDAQDVAVGDERDVA